MIHLTICSIFRDSESYLDQYLNCVEELGYKFANEWNLPLDRIMFMWLEGDSVDNTNKILQKNQCYLIEKGFRVTLFKYPTGQHYSNEDTPERWKRISDCWNTILKYKPESVYTIMVESDLVWDPTAIAGLLSDSPSHNSVIAPMLLRDHDGMGRIIFYDTHGFKRGGKNFQNDQPFWSWQEGDGDVTRKLLMPVESLGGLVIADEEAMKNAYWGEEDCVLKWSPETKLFMHKGVAVWHP